MDMAKKSMLQHDPRIQALIKQTDKKTLALWAIDCFNRQRGLVKEEYVEENKIIDHALATLNLWLEYKMTMWEARKYCWTVLKAAREIESKDKVACQMLRACSHTLATCHVATHAEGSAMYVLSAMQYAYKGNEDLITMLEDERAWQIKHLETMIANSNNS